MAKSAGGVRGGSGGSRGRNGGTQGASSIGIRNGNARMKSMNEVRSQIERIQSYTHNTGVSPQRFFSAVGRVSSAVRQGQRMNPTAAGGRYQTNAYILDRILNRRRG